MWRSLTICLAIVAAARAAQASDDYPAVIRATIPTTQALPCTLCHAFADGRDAMIATDFGRSMVEFGMKGQDPASLERALIRNRDRRWDSDGDGVPDMEELVYGTDPNSLALSSSPELEYGCSISSMHHHEAPWHVATVFFASMLCVMRRRRNPERQ